MLSTVLLISGCRESTVFALYPQANSMLAVTHAVVGTTNGANTVKATFSERVTALSATNALNQFSISGCTANPSVAIAMSVVDNVSVATATLSGGNCADGTTVSIELHLDRVVNLSGDTGDSRENPTTTYSIDTDPAVTTLAAPVYQASWGALKNSDTVTHSITYTNTATQTLVASTGTTAAPPAGLTVSTTGSGVACDLEIVSPSVSGATLSLTNCIGDGSVLIEVDAGVSSSAAGLPSVATSQQVVLVQNTPATVALSGYSATGGAGGSNTITATFTSLMTALSSTNTSGELVITGCATTSPHVSSITMSDDGNGHSIATIHIAAGTGCVSGQQIGVQFHLENTNDLAGNPGLAGQNPALVQYLIP